MSFDLSYSLFFEVTIFHNFFLNDGESVFGNMNYEEKRNMIRKYDFEKFLAVSPSISTLRILKNYKMQFKKTKTGFKIFIKVKPLDKNDPFIKIPADLELIFVLKINDFQFENYTDLPFFSDRLFYFSNTIPRRAELKEPLPIPNPKKEIFDPLTFNYIPFHNSGILISEAFLASKEQSNYLYYDFESIESTGLFGAIAIATTAHNSESSIVNNQNKITNPSREFRIHFDNRKTFWKYINRKTATEIETTSAKPLTYSGFVEIDPLTDFSPSEPEESQYPNPSVKSIVKIDNNYYSQIFI